MQTFSASVSDIMLLVQMDTLLETVHVHTNAAAGQLAAVGIDAITKALPSHPDKHWAVTVFTADGHVFADT